ncbi:heme exporter protein CcmD [Iodobacter sp. CM08]|uniref:heme exporter protein CcmD n=1 Tax=Iodobacter sp. CM08 TaxID=3085902 RepID=UPI00298259D9|nr:heme exporter protein CcmD [Iodobacter sp. CM08]MDW5418438.1 heme exporter protein CcmD [Iodobacter sp. CM08]
MFSTLYWASFSDFIHMGGYGLYVWGSFIACVFGLGMEWLLIKQQRKQVLRHLQRMALAEEMESESDEHPALL